MEPPRTRQYLARGVHSHRRRSQSGRRNRRMGATQGVRPGCEMAGKVRVAVNVSPIQFANDLLPKMIEGALSSSGLSPDRLELEITEGVFLQETSDTDAMFQALKKSEYVSHSTISAPDIRRSAICELRRLTRSRSTRALCAGQLNPAAATARSLPHRGVGRGARYGHHGRRHRIA